MTTLLQLTSRLTIVARIVLSPLMRPYIFYIVLLTLVASFPLLGAYVFHPHSITVFSALSQGHRLAIGSGIDGDPYPWQ